MYEGAADAPCEELEGATPMELARSVRASSLAARGSTGLLRWPSDDAAKRSEQMLGLLLGIAPAEARLLRRGPVEAAGTAIDPSRWTYAYRGDFVTTDDHMIRENHVGGLSLDETVALASALMESHAAGLAGIEVTGPGRVSVMFNQLAGQIDPGTFPETGMRSDLAEGASDRLILMRESARICNSHPVNEVRVDLGENPASMLWLWGGGALTAFGRPFIGAPVRAAMISNSPLARGMARLCGMQYFELGDPWTDEARPELMTTDALTSAINTHDLTVVFVEAPRAGGGYGTPIEKVKSLDKLDIHVLGRVLDAVDRVAEARTMLVATPAERSGPSRTPFVIAGAHVERSGATRWQESTDSVAGTVELDADRCLAQLLGDY